MPFPMIPAALCVCFLLLWAFIGAMIFRGCQLAVEQERETDGHVVPLAHFGRRSSMKTRPLSERPAAVRAAS
jgi:hypothetical protein